MKRHDGSGIGKASAAAGVGVLGPWDQDVDDVFAMRTDIDRMACYDAATMKLEQMAGLLKERLYVGGDIEAPDHVVMAALALLKHARVAFRAAFEKDTPPRAG